MTWLRDDDDMLDHEKWRRALRDGGDSALLVWWRLRAWCARRLTDGVIPADMIAEVAELARSKSRMRALQALVDARLCARREDGALTIVDYLERNPSRLQVLAARDAATERKRKHRLRDSVTPGSQRDTPSLERPAANPQSQSHPIPIPESERDARAPEVPKVPGLEIVHPGPLRPSKREQAREAAAANLSAPPGLRYHFDPDWDPSPAHRDRAREYGLTDTEVLERAEDCRRKPIKHGFTTEDDHFFRELAWMKTDREKRQFKSKSERDAFEMPGKERRA